MPDPIFAHPRLAAIYDDLDGDRSDLDHYVAIVGEIGARSVLDIGCGTGALACRLAIAGHSVVGVDPAGASLQIARRKPGADRVSWVLGDATTLPDTVRGVDLAVMTGNVAQVFLDDDSWSATLRGIRDALKPGGHLVFEARDPAFQGWTEWTKEASYTVAETSDGPVESWVELIDVALPLVSFRWTYRFLSTRDELTSDSTLRFRSKDELTDSLPAEGFVVESIRDAPDRPAREFVFVTKRTE